MRSQKTLRALAKRVKISGRGRILRRRAGMSHNLTSKSRRRKRFLKHDTALSQPVARRIRKLLPHH